MPLEVETISGGRRMSDRVPVSTVTPSARNDFLWIILTTIMFTALAVGGIAFVYHQSAMNSLRADYQLQMERLQNQLRTQQLKEEIQTTPASR